MFSSKAKPMSSPSRVSIEEANSHLRLVHERVEQLESLVLCQSRQLVAAEEHHKQEIQRLTQTHERQTAELNAQIDGLKTKIAELEERLERQNLKLIEENAKQMEKLSQILKLTPNLDKLLKLLNSLMITKNTIHINSGNSGYDMNICDQLMTNGFTVADDSPVVVGDDYCQPFVALNDIKRCPKYKTTDESNCAVNEEEMASNTPSSTATTGSGHSPPSVGAVSGGGCRVGGGGQMSAHHKRTSNSKLRIGRSFNITANFSDDEEGGAGAERVSTYTTGRRPKTTNI